MTLQLDAGRTVTVAPRQRPVHDLPLYFWWQLAAGWICWMIASGVWAFRPRQLEGRLLLSALGAVLFSHGAAIYSCRELALNGAVFRSVSAITHLGTELHAAALLALVWVYPCRLGSERVLWLIAGAAFAAWMADTLQLAPSALWSHNLFVMLAFVVSLGFVAGQWQASRARPIERAIMQWFIPAIFLATFTSIGLLKLPLLFGHDAQVPQGWVFVVHALMYVGLALGILRYRLFDLDR